MASPNAKPSCVDSQADPAQKERQDKIVKLLHSQMMDFRLYNPHKLQICVEKLLQLFDNILHNPDAQKFRKASLLFAAVHLQRSTITAAVSHHAGPGQQCSLQARCFGHYKAK